MEVFIHGGQMKMRVSKKLVGVMFTAAHQTLKKDPNQFYLCLFNLEIQSEHEVITENYCTRLLKLLQNLMDQHDRDYPVIQDAVTHAGRLWQTLDQDKLCQELKKARERTNQCHHNKDSNQ